MADLLIPEDLIKLNPYIPVQTVFNLISNIYILKPHF